MKRVLIESPFAGDRANNLVYLDAVLHDSLARGEAPFASHKFYTLILDDSIPEQRKLGIEAGLAWGAAAELTAVYIDRGISDGMRLGIERAQVLGREVTYRSLRLPGRDFSSAAECYEIPK